MLNSSRQKALRTIARMNSPIKVPSRNTMAAHIINRLCDYNEIKCINFPGGSYLLERLLMKQWPDKHFNFIGIERDLTTFNEIEEVLPGSYVLRDKLNYRLDGHNRHPKILVSDIATVLKMTFEEFIDALYLNPEWAEEYGNWDCAWFDGCGYLCERTITTIARASKFFNPATPIVPAAITFARFREGQKAQEWLKKFDCDLKDRIGLLNKTLKRFHDACVNPMQTHEWCYSGHHIQYCEDHSPMCVAYGYFKLPGHVLKDPENVPIYEAV